MSALQLIRPQLCSALLNSVVIWIDTAIAINLNFIGRFVKSVARHAAQAQNRAASAIEIKTEPNRTETETANDTIC